MFSSRIDWYSLSLFFNWPNPKGFRTMFEQWIHSRWFKPLALAFFILTLFAAYSVAPHPPAEINAYILQAHAFLKGHLDIPAYTHDAAFYKGAYYVIHPPFPATLLIPFVAIGGPLDAEIVFLSLSLALISLWLLWRIFRRLKCDPPLCVWLCAAFFLGTGYWFVLGYCEGVWYFAHLVAVTCLIAAIHESLGGRGWLAGLFLGSAFLSRQLSLYAGVFLIAAIWSNPRFSGQTRGRILQLIGLATGFAVCFALYLYFNWVRFEHIFDTGYDYLNLSSFLKVRVERFGQFHWAYIPYNFNHLFLQGFNLEYHGADLMLLKGMDRFGTSLTFASPFVFFAFRAKGQPLLLIGAWLSIGMTLLHQLCYYNNGFVQCNTNRFTLDFLPIIMILIALGARQAAKNAWLKAAILYAILLNGIALFLVPALKWFQDDVLMQYIRIG